jgi:hypothetical protein
LLEKERKKIPSVSEDVENLYYYLYYLVYYLYYWRECKRCRVTVENSMETSQKENWKYHVIQQSHFWV